MVVDGLLWKKKVQERRGERVREGYQVRDEGDGSREGWLFMGEKSIDSVCKYDRRKRRRAKTAQALDGN